MDVLAHVLWTNAVFHSKYHRQRRWRYLAAFFGVLPDLISFVPVFLYSLIFGFHVDPEKLFSGSSWVFAYAGHSYNYTHSLVIFAALFVIVHLVGNLYFYFKNGPVYRFWFFWPLLGWALHILIDIPSHKGFYETPFLFPLSHARFHHGLSWADPTFMAVNYSALIIVYSILFWYQRRKYGNQ